MLACGLGVDVSVRNSVTARLRCQRARRRFSVRSEPVAGRARPRSTTGCQELFSAPHASVDTVGLPADRAGPPSGTDRAEPPSEEVVGGRTIARAPRGIPSRPLASEARTTCHVVFGRRHSGRGRRRPHPDRADTAASPAAPDPPVPVPRLVAGLACSDDARSRVAPVARATCSSSSSGPVLGQGSSKLPLQDLAARVHR